MLLPPEVLQNIFNGFGPEEWPEIIRCTLSWIFRAYPAAAAIHDLRYEFSDGTSPSRRRADREFIRNLLLLWLLQIRAGKLPGMRAVYELIKIILAGILTWFGGSRAWQQSYCRKMEVEYDE